MIRHVLSGLGLRAVALIGICGLAGLPVDGARAQTQMPTVALPSGMTPVPISNDRCHVYPVQQGYGAWVTGQAITPPGCDTATAAAAASPTGYSSPDLINHGGPTVTGTAHSFYFLNCISSCATDWGNPIQFLTDLFADSTGSFLHTNDQYTGLTSNGRYSTSSPGTAVTATTTHTMTDSELKTIITNTIKAQNPAGGGGGYSKMYSIFLPQGQDLCMANGTSCYCPDNNCNGGSFQFCAYHGSFDTTDNVGGAMHVIYQAQPYDNVGGCQVSGGPNSTLVDSVNNVFSHEIFETITDPDLNAWWRSSDGQEIGDICNFNIQNPIALNGHSYAIQKEYSNRVHFCVGTSTTFTKVGHDFNNDGQSDILWRDTSGNVSLWLMNSGAVSSALSVGNVGTSWAIKGIRDFNADGKADILWRDTSGNLAMWLMNGGSVSSSALVGSVSSAWTIAGTGDYNGDGNGDILWSDTSGNVAMWFMNGSTIASSALVGNIPSPWSITATSGKHIVWRNTTTGDVVVWIMNGATVSSAVSLGSVPTSWSIVGTGDFNADGNPDILWRDSSGNVAIWLLTNTGQVSSSVFVGNVPTTWSINLAGDFDGDFKSDIVWRDTSGNLAIWRMNGGTVLQSLSLGNVSTAWTVQR